MERLKASIRLCMEGRSEYEDVAIDAVNRRGRTINCRVSATPLRGADRELRGVVLVMEEWLTPVAMPDDAPGADRPFGAWSAVGDGSADEAGAAEGGGLAESDGSMKGDGFPEAGGAMKSDGSPETDADAPADPRGWRG